MKTIFCIILSVILFNKCDNHQTNNSDIFLKRQVIIKKLLKSIKEEDNTAIENYSYLSKLVDSIEFKEKVKRLSIILNNKEVSKRKDQFQFINDSIRNGIDVIITTVPNRELDIDSASVSFYFYNNDTQKCVDWILIARSLSHKIDLDKFKAIVATLPIDSSKMIKRIDSLKR